jgi:hypothetical protein
LRRFACSQPNRTNAPEKRNFNAAYAAADCRGENAEETEQIGLRRVLGGHDPTLSSDLADPVNRRSAEN